MTEMVQNKPSLRKVYWKDVRDDVAKVNPEFAKIVDDLDPGKDYPLYLATYPYGDVIVDEGKFFLPTENGTLAPMDSDQISNEVRKDLSYTGGLIPASLVLNKSVEIFIKGRNHILPWDLRGQGSLLALWRYLETEKQLHPGKIFNITSGARSVFMLPNIGDVSLHKNLKRDFNVQLPPPKELSDQWDVFVDILKHPSANNTWSSSLLFFTNNWFKSLYTDKKWVYLYGDLMKIGWKGTNYWRNKIFYDFALSTAQENRNLKPNPYLVDTVKHLLAVGLGGANGFGFSVDDMAIPLYKLQSIYINSYNLKKYAPIVLQPVTFSPDSEREVAYYSLQFPTTFEFSPKSRKLSSTLNDLIELKHVMTVFLDELLKGRLQIEDTLLRKFAEEVGFEFYHSKFDCHGEVKNTKELLGSDHTLSNLKDLYGDREFADSGAFVRGCVQIFKKTRG